MLKIKMMPDNWWIYHHKDCGTKYRGCHPKLCPKKIYEDTGKWIGPSFKPNWIDQYIEDSKYMVYSIEKYLNNATSERKENIERQVAYWKGHINGLQKARDHMRAHPWWLKIPIIGELMKGK